MTHFRARVPAPPSPPAAVGLLAATALAAHAQFGGPPPGASGGGPSPGVTQVGPLHLDFKDMVTTGAAT